MAKIIDQRRYTPFVDISGDGFKEIGRMMHNAIKTMLDRYHCISRNDYENALKEIMQEVALLGLWRQKFFEHAIFYGGTSLRILHGIERFSEDLDFSLLDPDPKFSLSPYIRAVQDELNSFGFEVTIESKTSKLDSQIESAFIKAGTRLHLLKLKAPNEVAAYVQSNSVLRIKFELDVDPPGGFSTEMKSLFHPTTFQVRTMTIPDLFASKLHAVIARQWKQRVKGRDFYDLIWYVKNFSKVNLTHLKARLVQSGHWKGRDPFGAQELRGLLIQRIHQVDFELARKDVSPFLRGYEQDSLSLWSVDFFTDLIERIEPL